MALKFRYQAQQVGDTAPDVALTGDPAVDQVTLRAAGYAAGRIMTRIASATSGRGSVVVPMDGNLAGKLPYGTLINGAGNYAESIGPSGSGKTPVCRAFPIFDLSIDPIEPACYDVAPTAAYVDGNALYAGTGAKVGMWTSDKAANAVAVGVCSHVPTTSEPWLGVTQTF
jgi:hypothetical protein